MPGVQVIRDGEFVGVVAPDRADGAAGRRPDRRRLGCPPQPAPGDLDAYLRSHPVEGEGWISPFLHEQGDVEAALAAGPVRIDACYSAAYIAHVPLEPRAAVARWAAGRVTVWAGTSTPFRARGEVAAALGIAESDVEIIVPDYGGGFGGKHGGAVAIEAARLARAAGRPVKVQWSRDEEFHQGYLRPGGAARRRGAARTRPARISGWSFTNINSGQAGIQSPYRIPHQRVAFQPAESPLPQGPYRALASTANHFARESVMDELARPARGGPARLPAAPSGRRAAGGGAACGGAAVRLGRPAAARPGPGTGAGTGIGTGIALGTEKGGRVATAAQVRVEPDGTLQILRLVTAFDCGAVVSPDNLANQVEGAVMMGLGGAMFEAIDFAGGRILNASMSGYRVPRLPDLPEFEVVLIDRPDQPSAGAGEAPIVAVAPAIGNAIFHACGVRLGPCRWPPAAWSGQSGERPGRNLAGPGPAGA